jgi:ketosteroid isomerase-like protein
LYAGQSQFDKARTALEMAIRTNPSYATAHENLGDVYAKLASQAYNKALQLDASNAGVPPKLALIRELFSPTGAKNQRPGQPPAAAPAAMPPVATKPAPTLPGPVSAKASSPAAVQPPTATSTQASPVAASAVSSTAPPAPVAVSASAAPSSDNSSKDAEAAVQAWARAWAARDVKAYLASYGKDFSPPGSMSRSAWEEERRQRITSKSKITVKLENLTVTASGNTAIAKFRQDYKANGLAVSSRKTLDLVKNGERWHIVKESTGT